MGILSKLEEKLEGNSKSKNPMRQQEHGLAEPGTVPLPSKIVAVFVCPCPSCIRAVSALLAPLASFHATATDLI